MTKTRLNNRVSGSISVHPRGFGFLNFEGDTGGASAFIVPPDLNPFLTGDLVTAKVHQGEDGRFSATELLLEQRQRGVLFGEVVKRRGGLWLKTDDEISNTDWELAGEAPIGAYVLAQVEGDRMVVARVLEPDDDIPLERLIAKYDLVEDFDEECYQHVDQIVGVPHTLGSRRDLRHIPTVTIDAPSTTDLDDAVAVLPADSDGGVRLLVSIADPAEFITESSVLDEEARARGTSTYLTDRVLPMLPDELSSGHLSLLPGQDRCCLTVEMRIDPEGEIQSVDVYESLICSKTRISYHELADWLELGTLTESLLLVKDSLPWFRTATSRLTVARARRGGVSISGDDAARVTLDDSGKVVGTKPFRTTEAHTMIERFMVAANEAVARWLSNRGVPGVFRIHQEPSEEAVDLLSASAEQFGLYPGFSGRLTPLALAAFDRQIRGVACEPAVRSILRGTLEKARYTPQPGLHLGLGTPLYLHFTSPLRRYSDFVVHRFVKAYLKGERLKDSSTPKVAELCHHLNHRSTMAGKAEAFRRRMLLAELMVERIGEEFDAHITRVLPFGLVVQMDDSLVEGLVPFESLRGVWTTTTTCASSEREAISLGEAVRVKLVSAEPELGRLEYSFL